LGQKINNDSIISEGLSNKEIHFDENDFLVIEYTDFYSGNGKKVRVKNLGEKFASINSFFFDYLKEYNLPVAFVQTKDKNKLNFLKYNKFPFSVKILNIIDKRTAKIFSRKEGEFINFPIFEIHYGNGKDSVISESHVICFDLCSNEELKLIYRISSKVNAVLKSFFERRGFYLAEATCNFGKFEEKIFLVDDLSPHNLKVVPLNSNGNFINPYLLNSSAQIKHYTDLLFNLMSA
jgi:phosphoribosylaminoimidazole-succinocarboxamide synthase